jgi:hypothetical protein
MPENEAELNALLKAKKYPELVDALKPSSDPEQITRTMNWSSTKLLQGETGLLGFTFVRDLWRFAKVAPPSEKLQFQQTAAVILLYTYQTIKLDGLKCADRSAPDLKSRELIRHFKEAWSFLRETPPRQRVTILASALALERTTAPARSDDAAFCFGDMSQGSRPALRPAAEWRPEAEKARKEMPEKLARFLKLAK